MLSKPSFKSLSLLRLIEDLSSIVVPLLLFAVVLTVPSPRWLGESARYDCGFFGVAIALLFFVTFRCPGRIGRALSLSALMMTFALPLARLWHTGASDSFIIGGLLPFSDATVHYSDARNILAGGTMGELSPQRPLFPGLLVSLLALTQQNLQVTIAILVAMNAIACFFVARELQKNHGATVAALVSMQVFFFYRVFIGKTMTENLGLALGLLGFAALWRSAHTQKLGTGLLGLFFLTFALNARIGTILVLPAVILWGAYRFRQSARLSWGFLLGGFGTVFLASTLNILFLKQVGLPDGNPPFANFSFTLYGIVTHSSWYQVMLDYPELEKLGLVKQTRVIYDLALELIQQNPLRLVTGIFRGWTDFFLGNYSWFIWEDLDSPHIDPVFRPLAALGGWSCLRNWKAPAASLLWSMAIGAFLTVPLLPLIDSGVRPYAATIVILFTLSALGFGVLIQDVLQPLIRWFGQRGQGRQSDRPVVTHSTFSALFSSHCMVQGGRTSSALLIFGLTLSVLSCVAPMTIAQFASAPPQIPSTFVCPTGQQSALFRVNPGSGINLVDDNAIRQSNIPNIRVEDFQQGLESFSSWAVKQKVFLRQFLKKNMTIVDTSGLLVVANRQLIPKQKGWMVACGKTKSLDSYGFIFRAKSLHLLNEAGQTDR
jgi:hypothetical protein